MSLTRSLKEIRGDYRATGTFHTPPELAMFMRSLIPGDPADVYDPTCGTGSLLSTFAATTKKYGQDINAEAVAIAAETVPNFHGAVGDVLEDPAWRGRRFEAIVANPPFSVKWSPHPDQRWDHAPTLPTSGRADFAFLLHIAASLAHGGVAAVLCFPGICYRGQREGRLRRWMVETLNIIDRVVLVPGDTFTDTAIATVCLVLRNGRDADDQIVFEDREHQVSRAVDLAEVAQNGYLLSPTTYVQPETPESEPVHTRALERQARARALQKIDAEIEFSRVVADLEGWQIGGLLDDIGRLLDAKRRVISSGVARAMGE